MRPLVELIRAAVRSPSDRALPRATFGSVDPEDIAAAIAAWAERELGSGIAGGWLWNVSVGCVAGLVLDGGERVVVKCYAPDRDADRLRAVLAVQRVAHERGLCAPEPIAGPAPMRAGLAIAERALDIGRRPNLRNPVDQAAAARGWVELSRALEDAGSLLAVPDLDPGVVGGLYPMPHSPLLFDFDATSTGAEWIDALASEASASMRPTGSTLAVVHTDWRGDNLRVDDEGENVVAVFDWESVRLSAEANALGLVAAMHSIDWSDPAGPYFATGPECVAFARAVEAARTEAFTPVEWDAVVASIVFGWCYTARCEHARAAVGDDKDQFGMRRRLAADGRVLLDSLNP